MDTAFENGFALNQGSILKKVDSTPTTDSTNLISSGGVKTYVDQKDAATNERIDTVNTQLAASFFFKGSSTYAELPVSDNTINDTYYVTDNDKQCWYSWDGTAWVQSSMSQVDYAGLIAQLKADMSSDFSTQKTYNVGDFCLYGADGKLYVCKTAITTTGAAWDSTKWDEVAFADAISDLILATDTQPTSTANKIWLDTDEVPDIVEVVTVEDLANIVATEFATASAYSTGDYVMHNAELYRAKQNSAANDGWVAVRWQKITVTGEMTDELTNVKTQLSDISGNEALEFSDPSLREYINTNQEIGTVITWDDPSVSATKYPKWCVVECAENDLFTLNGSGGNGSRLWAFLNSNQELLSKSDANITVSDLIIKAPVNSAYLIVNNEVANAQCYKGELLVKKIDDTKTQINEISTQINDISESNQNLYTGDATITFTASLVVNLGVTLPAGTYTISAEVTSSGTDSNKSRASFGGQSTDLLRGEWTSNTVTVPNSFDKITFLAETNTSASAGDTATWENIQLGYGSEHPAEYVPHKMIAVDDVARNEANSASEVAEEAMSNVQNIGRITWNGASNANVLSINTTDRTITFGSSAFLCFRSARYSLGGKTCTYPASGSHMVCYYSIADVAIYAVAYSNFVPDGNIILFDFIRSNWGVDANTLSCNYSVDGTNYICKAREQSDASIQNIIYVSPNGNDSNIGNKNNPIRSISEAIIRGAKNICCLNGVYRITSAMEFSNLQGVSIFADDTDTYPSPGVPRERPTFIGGDDYTEFTSESDGTKSFVPTSIPGRYTRVFIDHDLSPMSDSTRPSPNACLWLHYANKTSDKRMTPVLSTADLLANSDTFYYDGSKVYINANNTTYISATVGFDYNSILKFSACNNISITGINFKYGGNSNLIIWNCNNVNVKNCKSEYTSFSDGISTNFSETTFVNCESFKARNDGFNCHYYGVSHYVDCHSHYNGDDGESSHEYCVVEVNGGEYDHNGKGGHSPVNGCKFYDNGSYTHHNAFGFYCVAQGSDSTVYVVEPMLIMNAVSINNGSYDILANRAEVIVGNTKYNSVSEIGGGTLTNLNNINVNS